MLNVNIGSLQLNTPIICASGTFGFGEEIKELVDFSHIGAIVTKTITQEARAGNPPPRIYETGCGVINSVGLENPGVEGFIQEKLPKLSTLDTQAIVSVGGFSFQEYEYILAQLESQQSIKAFEINLSCPNLRLKKMISQDKQRTFDLVTLLRKTTKKTLIIKITPEVTDITQIAQAIEEAGADAVSLVNTFCAMAINIETQQPYLGNTYGGYSGRAIKPMSLYRVWRVAQAVSIPVIGGGGIETAEDALEFLLAGARAVSLGTVNLVHPNQAAIVAQGLKAYMQRKKIEHIDDLGRCRLET